MHKWSKVYLLEISTNASTCRTLPFHCCHPGSRKRKETKNSSRCKEKGLTSIFCDWSFSSRRTIACDASIYLEPCCSSRVQNQNHRAKGYMQTTLLRKQFLFLPTSIGSTASQSVSKQKIVNSGKTSQKHFLLDKS